MEHSGPSGMGVYRGGGLYGGGGAVVSAVGENARSWRQLACKGGQIPGKRSGAASVMVGTRLYIFGGYGGSGRLDDFYCYDLDEKTWQRIESRGDAPGARENNGLVEHAGCLYLFGGYNGSTWLNDFHEFNLASGVWRVVPPNQFVPSARFGYVSVVYAHFFVLFGGYDGATWLNDMYQLDFRTMLWSHVHASGSIPSIRSCPSWTLSTDGATAYVFGGYDGVQRMNDFFQCDLATYTWSVVPASGGSAVPSPRYFHACAAYGRSLFVFGGYNGSERLNDMYEYGFDTQLWREVRPTPLATDY